MAIRILSVKYCVSVIVGILIPAICFSQSSLCGKWKGTLNIAPGNSITLGFEIGDGTDNAATMDSPEQGVFGLKCIVAYQSADSISLSIKQIGMEYDAKLQSDKLNGTFKQHGYSFPLVLERGTIDINRPQTPVPPFEYNITEFDIPNNDAGVTLSGTFTTPANFSKTTPIVVMISGSGLQNRDEEIFYHKPFAVIADYLANNGIASFRYDDRGYGKSSGDGAIATTHDLASDASAIVSHLKKRYKGNKIGVLGHSEGGQIAFMLAGGNNRIKPDFLITLGAPTIKGDSLLAEQSAIYLRSVGIDSVACEDYRKAVLKLYSIMQTDGLEAAKKSIQSICPGWDFLPQYAAMKSNIKAITEQTTPWLLYSIGYSPANDISDIKSPMLLLYGAKDSQVPCKLNMDRAKKLNAHAIVESFEGLNHLMQHCNSGMVSEYGKIQETIAPEVLTRIVEFISSFKQN